MSTATATDEKPPTFKEIMAKASKSAVRGGTAGACAMGANVAALMVCILYASVMRRILLCRSITRGRGCSWNLVSTLSLTL